MTVHIVCTIDDTYAQHCAVMLASLFHNNQDTPLKVYILTDTLKSTSLKKLNRFLSQSGHEYSICEIDKHQLGEAPVTHHISLATYFRLFIPKIIPADVQKVVFIDSDIVIRKSIAPLWNTDITNFSHAATIAAGMDDYAAKIGLPSNTLYFNAGLMLINLNVWRKLNIFERGCQLIREQPDRLTWWDQDVLNLLLHDSWLPLDLTWNAQPFLYENFRFDNYEIEKRYQKFNALEAKTDPAIVHFVGGGSAKPWHHACKHPFGNEYSQYLKETPWKHVKPIGKPSLIATARFHLGLGSKLRHLFRFFLKKTNSKNA